MATTQPNQQYSADERLGRQLIKPRLRALRKYQNANSFAVVVSCDARDIHDIGVGDVVDVFVMLDGIAIVPDSAAVAADLADQALVRKQRIVQQNGPTDRKVNLTSTGGSIHELAEAVKASVAIYEHGLWVRPVYREGVRDER